MAEEINHGSNHGSNIYDDNEDDPALKRAIEESLAYGNHGPSIVRGGGTASSSGGVKEYFYVDLAYRKTRLQQTIEACINKLEYSTRIGKAWSKWFHANDIPGHKANCPYFVGALKLTQDLGKGVLSHYYFCHHIIIIFIFVGLQILFLLQRCASPKRVRY